MKICIVDDEQNCIDNLHSLLYRYSKESGLEMDFDIFKDGESFKAAYKPDYYDIVFLDIYIGQITGMDLAKEIRSHSENGMIIFCTTSITDMPEAFRYHAFEYVIKPAEYERIQRIMEDAIGVLPNLEKYLDFTAGKERVHLAYSSLISVTTSGHYLDICAKDASPITIRMTMTEFLKYLEGDERFIMINKGILVNMDRISSIVEKNAKMDDGTSFPIKVRESAAIKAKWQDYKISRIRKGQKR